MAVITTSADAVQTVIDILDAYDGGYGSAGYGTSAYASSWPSGTKPDPIEYRWDSSRNEKRKRKTPAAYVYSPDIGTQEQFGRDADVKVQTEIVDIDVWARDAATANTIASDAVSILEDFWNDSKAYTQWNRIRPQSTNDRRGEESPETIMGRRHNQYIVSPRVELEREDAMGT